MITDRAALVYQLDRTLLIQASRETVFRFFTDPDRWASWWGAGSTIDAQVGGRVLIRYPDGSEAVGEVHEIVPPERLVFSYGYAKGTPIPPSGSLVTIVLEEERRATRLRLTHAFAEASVRDEHVQGWRYQLSLFANVVTNEVHADASALADRWFDAWSEPDAARRDPALRAIASTDIRMRDQFSAIDGIADLLEHVAAAIRFMPGIRMLRAGHVGHCQGMAIAGWTLKTADGQERGTGTNVFEFAMDGRIESVTGFWHAPSSQTPREKDQS
jgi:uncharacterized protein YndB with AHSA1/START domain